MITHESIAMLTLKSSKWGLRTGENIPIHYSSEANPSIGG
jgi:hypothetical protein